MTALEEIQAKLSKIREEADSHLVKGKSKSGNLDKDGNMINKLGDKVSNEDRSMDSDQYSSSLAESDDSSHDDYVTIVEHRDLIKKMQAEFKKRDDAIADVQRQFKGQVKENVRLIKMIDGIDWSLIKTIEGRLADILSEF